MVEMIIDRNNNVKVVERYFESVFNFKAIGIDDETQCVQVFFYPHEVFPGTTAPDYASDPATWNVSLEGDLPDWVEDTKSLEERARHYGEEYVQNHTFTTPYIVKKGLCIAKGDAIVSVPHGVQCYAYDNSVVTVKDGGRCQAHGHAKATVKQCGYCRAYNNATMIVDNGGNGDAWGRSVVTVKDGGNCLIGEKATATIERGGKATSIESFKNKIELFVPNQVTVTVKSGGEYVRSKTIVSSINGSETCSLEEVISIHNNNSDVIILPKKVC